MDWIVTILGQAFPVTANDNYAAKVIAADKYLKIHPKDKEKFTMKFLRGQATARRLEDKRTISTILEKNKST